MAIKSDILKSLVPFDDGIRQRNLQSRVDTLYGKDRQANPFLDKNGNLFNKYINYQSVLNNPNVSTAAKRFISQATGLSPSVGAVQSANVNTSQNGGSAGNVNQNTAQGSQSPQTGTSGNKFVDTAKKYLGTPYVWGGASPSGFDCSGLMQYVYAQNGIKIPRVSQDQFKSGSAVKSGNLAPGDLVFFKGYTKDAQNPGHVGMYIGGGKYIQAPKTGDVVKVSSLSDRSDYVGARRYY